MCAGGYSSQKEDYHKYKYIAKEIRTSILVRYIIVREIWLHGLGGLVDSYLSDIIFDQLSAGDTTDCRLGMVYVTCCIVRLYRYVTFCHACIILFIVNYITHMGIKIISWSWGVCDVTMISDFSYIV